MSIIAILDFYAALLSFIIYVDFNYRLNFENISNCTHLALLVAKVHYTMKCGFLFIQVGDSEPLVKY